MYLSEAEIFVERILAKKLTDTDCLIRYLVAARLTEIAAKEADLREETLRNYTLAAIASGKAADLVTAIGRGME